MKKVIALCGSPRKEGSTATLAEAVLQASRGRGAAAKAYFLNGMNIRGCQSCFACKADGRCVMQDDMQELYGEIAAADGIVLATPVYMWQMTAQLKLAVDRLFPFLRPDYSSYLAPGKKVLLAVTQGRPDTATFRHYFEDVAKLLQFLGFGPCEILIAGGTRKSEDIRGQAEVMDAAKRFGAWLTE